LALTYRRAFKIGDRVKIADFVGDGVNPRLQVTHLRTIKNEEIAIPCILSPESLIIYVEDTAQTCKKSGCVAS